MWSTFSRKNKRNNKATDRQQQTDNDDMEDVHKTNHNKTPSSSPALDLTKRTRKITVKETYVADMKDGCDDDSICASEENIQQDTNLCVAKKKSKLVEVASYKLRHPKHASTKVKQEKDVRKKTNDTLQKKTKYRDSGPKHVTDEIYGDDDQKTTAEHRRESGPRHVEDDEDYYSDNDDEDENNRTDSVHRSKNSGYSDTNSNEDKEHKHCLVEVVKYGRNARRDVVDAKIAKNITSNTNANDNEHESLSLDENDMDKRNSHFQALQNYVDIDKEFDLLGLDENDTDKINAKLQAHQDIVDIDKEFELLGLDENAHQDFDDAELAGTTNTDAIEDEEMITPESLNELDRDPVLYPGAVSVIPADGENLSANVYDSLNDISIKSVDIESQRSTRGESSRRVEHNVPIIAKLVSDQKIQEAEVLAENIDVDRLRREGEEQRTIQQQRKKMQRFFVICCVLFVCTIIGIIVGVVLRPSDSKSCTTCTNKKNEWMINYTKTCESETWQINNYCINDTWWVENKFCRQSCFLAGRGYVGDECCPPGPTTPMPTTPPTTSPPTITPLPTGLCANCTNNITTYMDAEHLTCENYTWGISNLCKDDQWWVDSKFCQKSCFVAGRGYAGDNCC